MLAAWSVKMAVWRIRQLLPQEHLATHRSVRQCKLGESIVCMGCSVTGNTHCSGSPGSGQPWKGCTGMHGICWFKAFAKTAGPASDSLRAALQGPSALQPQVMAAHSGDGVSRHF